ncbi:MAG TPA: aromatic ring-hydroxylating dioxygenase subunit alpha [Chthoniobacterales bacterium]|jgi:phenylpropionate dioxygenase-like ring-hydroxylating dioxygenase large terminal subunit
MAALRNDTLEKINACEEAVLRSAPSRSIRPERALDEVFADIQQTAARPLSQATTLPPEAYTSEAFYAWEVEHIFKREWQCLAHLSQIPNAGDFLTLDLLGEPLLVVNGKDSVVRALSRTCPHRGMDIMPPGFGRDGHGTAEPRADAPGAGHTRLLLCPYHAWTFELDGRLKACPEMHRAEGFTRDAHGLREFRTEIWNGFVFVNLDGQAAPLAPRLAEMNADFGQWAPADMQLVIQREWDCPFNWKVLVENFMESYHHLGAHAKTLQPMMPARDTWNEQERELSVRCHLPFKESVLDELHQREHAFGFPTIAALDAPKKAESGLFLVFPHFLIFTLPDRIVWYRIVPLGPGRLKLLTTMLVPKTTAARPDFDTLLEAEMPLFFEFHLEDMEMCTAIQRGMSSLGAQRGRLSHLEMSVWLVQRYLAARIRGTWPTLDQPAAPGQR